MKKIALLFCLFCVNNLLSAQAPKDSTKTNANRLVFGIEQDILPYVLSGYIATLWMGTNKMRVRCSYALANNPRFFLPKDIAGDRVRAFGISWEFFFKEDYKGFWLGPGIGYWSNTIKNLNNTSIKNESFVFSLGAGYNHYLTKWLYISPWLAAHTRISGNSKVVFDNTTFKPMIVTPEVSFKIGVRFPQAVERRIRPKK